MAEELRGPRQARLTRRASVKRVARELAVENLQAL